MEDVGNIILRSVNGVMEILNTVMFDGYYLGIHVTVTPLNVCLYSLGILICYRILKYMLD